MFWWIVLVVVVVLFALSWWSSGRRGMKPGPTAAGDIQREKHQGGSGDFMGH